MKICVLHTGVKRQIVGSFALCGSREDLRHIANTILAHYGEGAPSGSYGWVDVLPRDVGVEHPVDLKPIPWSAPA